MQQHGTCTSAVGGNVPGFFNQALGKYWLTATSSAVDAGLGGRPSQRAYDLVHSKRVMGAHPDCGAYALGGFFWDDFESGDAGAWDGMRPLP